MQEFLQSLSLGSASLLVAAVSGVAAVFISRVSSAAFAWIAAVLIPFAVAYCAYWTPVWLGSSDRAQYFAWEFIGVGGPFVAGLLLSLFITFAVRRRAKSHV